MHPTAALVRELGQREVLTIATSIGALKSGACIASTVFPKQMKVVMSMVIALYANVRSAGLLIFPSWLKTFASALICAVMSLPILH